MRQPGTPRGIPQRVEPAAGDADRLQMVVHGDELASWQAKGFQSDVVCVVAPSGGKHYFVDLDGLAVESRVDAATRHGPAYRRQLCLKMNRDTFASQRLRDQFTSLGFAVGDQGVFTYQKCYRRAESGQDGRELNSDGAATHHQRARWNPRHGRQVPIGPRAGLRQPRYLRHVRTSTSGQHDRVTCGQDGFGGITHCVGHAHRPLAAQPTEPMKHCCTGFAQ